MNLKTLDPEIIEKLLEGAQDSITPLAKSREQFYQSQACPNCGGNAFQKFGYAHSLFISNDPLPRYHLRCKNCNCSFNPHSGIVTELGNIGKAFVPSVPLINKD